MKKLLFLSVFVLGSAIAISASAQTTNLKSIGGGDFTKGSTGGGDFTKGSTGGGDFTKGSTGGGDLD